MIAISSRELRPGNHVGTINDNPKSGDYSVGCLQVNIIKTANADNLSNIARIASKYGYIGGINQSELAKWLGNPNNNAVVANYLYKNSTIARQWPNTSIMLGIKD